jgi:hypothetical protein
METHAKELCQRFSKVMADLCPAIEKLVLVDMNRTAIFQVLEVWGWRCKGTVMVGGVRIFLEPPPGIINNGIIFRLLF